MNVANFLSSREEEIIEVGVKGAEAVDVVQVVGVQLSKRCGLKVPSISFHCDNLHVSREIKVGYSY